MEFDMKNTFFKTLLLIIFFIYPSIAQDPKPCSAPEASQFDFWLGEWDASWKDGGKGVNKISKILGECVIHEQFDATPSSPLIGKSVSVYNTRTNKWHQTWVDNSGAYLDFTGQWENGKMILSRSVKLKSKTIMQRMVWYNISHDKFNWNWEASKDGGKSWKINWQINYTRK